MLDLVDLVGRLLLAALFLSKGAAFLAHAYWKESDPGMRAAQQAQFWKNIALTGAALVLPAMYADGREFDLALGFELF
jgi:putative oxidoreductase